MANIVLILGESGTGKSTSLRNFSPDDVAYVNVSGKALPFRSAFTDTLVSTDYTAISRFIKGTDRKVIVVDDAQYIMAFQYMHRIRENGWDKFNDIQNDFFKIIEDAKGLAEDKIVYFLSHIETKEDGRQKIKTIGKMLDEKITIEGMFTIVLKTYVADGKYYFVTQNSGNDTVKSPIDMFTSITIDNDLKYVTEKIRNYYHMAGSKSDAEMAVDDKAVAGDVVPNEKPKRSRRRKAAQETTNAPAEVAVPKESESEAASDNGDEPQVETQAEPPAEAPAEKPTRRRRKVRTEIPDEDIPF